MYICTYVYICVYVCVCACICTRICPCVCIPWAYIPLLMPLVCCSMYAANRPSRMCAYACTFALLWLSCVLASTCISAAADNFIVSTPASLLPPPSLPPSLPSLFRFLLHLLLPLRLLLLFLFLFLLLPLPLLILVLVRVLLLLVFLILITGMGVHRVQRHQVGQASRLRGQEGERKRICLPTLHVRRGLEKREGERHRFTCRHMKCALFVRSPARAHTLKMHTHVQTRTRVRAHTHTCTHALTRHACIHAYARTRACERNSVAASSRSCFQLPFNAAERGIPETHTAPSGFAPPPPPRVPPCPREARCSHEYTGISMPMHTSVLLERMPHAPGQWTHAHTSSY